VNAWARVAAHFVRPGGVFYIHEVHPVAQVWQDEGVQPGELRLHYPYFTSAEPFEFDSQGSYADPDARLDVTKEYGWNHSMAEIVTALASAGLRIDLLREFPYTEWAMAFLEERKITPDGETESKSTWWLPADAGGELPLFFALRASKPAGP
jgi:hypothetical protein